MNKYDVFLFDADGTLFDYDKAEENALKIMFDYCEFNYSEDIRSKYREINSQIWESYEKGEISKIELQTLRFSRLFNDIGVYYDIKTFNEKYLNELGKGSFLINGALEICKKITSCNKKIYIVTNGILATQKARIEHSQIKEYISDFFVSEFIGFQKPHIKYFEYVFSHIPQIENDRFLIIGDSLSADIAGGNNAGIDSCWFNKSGDINSTNIIPTYEINKLNELDKYIN
ncbi:noncanonical pyrimidine nucleotidase, YjjG family protein [Spirochaetia bacterium]|nr:noncanonical pyrimidine nucleotidase, YjjG family protein [Spirochaetia bacterium]